MKIKVEFFLLIFGLITGYIIFYFSLFVTPPERNMGDLVRIMYIHVPLAWVSMISFTLVFLFSILYLFKKDLKLDIYSESAAEIGVLYNFLTLITGMLWAKAVWGHYWVWDPRLTTTLILFFLYSSYLLLRRFIETPDKRARFSSVLGVIIYVDVPFVYFSVKLWRSVHPSPFTPGDVLITPSMRIALFLSFIPYLFLFLFLFLLRYKIGYRLFEKLERA
ncbi:MAG: cytochrome c biogenesis protein CcsA [Candidatus Hydrothermales bacterium]